MAHFFALKIDVLIDQNGESYLVSEKEFDQLKHQFLEQKNEPFVFEWKAGTLFRNIN